MINKIFSLTKFTIFFLLIAVIDFSIANAEYRVYQYYVKSRYQYTTQGQNYLVTSTLDPVSYLSYHGGDQSIQVELLRTWMCKGHTGNHIRHCKDPLVEPTQQPSQQPSQ